MEEAIAEFKACVGFRDIPPKLNAKTLSLQIENRFEYVSLDMGFVPFLNPIYDTISKRNR
jgi:hypothetical protein